MADHEIGIDCSTTGAAAGSGWINKALRGVVGNVRWTGLRRAERHVQFGEPAVQRYASEIEGEFVAQRGEEAQYVIGRLRCGVGDGVQAAVLQLGE